MLMELELEEPYAICKSVKKIGFHRLNFSLHNKKSTAAAMAYRSLYSSDVVKPGVYGNLMSPSFKLVVWALSVMSHGDIKSTTGGDGIFL